MEDLKLITELTELINFGSVDGYLLFAACKHLILLLLIFEYQTFLIVQVLNFQVLHSRQLTLVMAVSYVSKKKTSA